MVIDIVLSNGNKIILDKDAQIEWIQENMFFEEDIKLRGKYSYPFSIDRKSNSHALDFPDVMQQYGEIVKKSCIVYISGIEFYKGQLNILDWSDDVINVAITRNTEEVDTSMYIDEMDLSEYTSIATHTNRNADKEKFFPEVDYSFPQFYQYNEETIKKYGGDSRGELNLIVNWRNGDTEAADGTEVVVPMFYLLSVLRDIFGLLGQSLKTKLFTDSLFNRTLIYNPITVVSDQPNCLKIECFTYNGGYGVVRMRDKLSCFTVPVGANVSMMVYEYDQYGINNTTTVSYNFVSGDVSSIANLMTAIRVAFLTVVTNATLISEDYTIDLPAFTVQLTTGDEMQIQPVGMVAPDPTARVDRGIFPLPISFNDTWVYETTVKMKNHLPHITISTLLNAIKSGFNLAIFLDEVNEVVRIYRRNDLVNQSDKKDYSEYLLDIIEGNPNTPPNYKLIYDHDSENDALTETLENITTNIEAGIAPVTEINIEAGTLATENLRNSNTGFITQPKVDQELGDYSNKVNFGLRFLYLNGYVADDNGQFLVNANNDGLLPNQIFQYQYRDWYDLIKRMKKAPVIYMDFGFDKLKSMEPFIWKVMHNDFLWKRISTVIHNTNGIQPSKVEGYKL